MNQNLNILALEPYYGGSHKTFLDRLVSDSTHNWSKMTLPPWKWKWRMMHSALEFAGQIDARYSILDTGEDEEHPSSLSELRRTGRTSNIELLSFSAEKRKFSPTSNESENLQLSKSPDPQIIFCSDMLNLAEFKGLASAKFADIPIVAYFHENQLTYPTHYEKKKDRYFGWINITTALAADAVWFNSEYHMDSFLDEVTARIKKAPDCRPANLADSIRKKSIIIPQGINSTEHGAESMGERKNTALKILWAARWEFDKNPADFFDALRIVNGQGIDFRLSVVGGNPEDKNPVFIEAEKEFRDHIDHWGFLESKQEYQSVLMESDVVVSTAIHEFFGISIAEAVAAGAFPLVPHRLAYPEVLKETDDDSGKESFFFDGSSANLAEKIANLAKKQKESNSIWEGDENRGIRKVSRFYWENVIPQVDKQLSLLSRGKN